MKIELYRPYRTRGGWKAVVVEKMYKDHGYIAYHEKDEKGYMHQMNGKTFSPDYDLVEEWKEPRTETGYVYMDTRGCLQISCVPVINSHVLAQKEITITEGEFYV